MAQANKGSFKPGHSGNPTGKPRKKGQARLQEMADAAAAKTLIKIATGGVSGSTRATIVSAAERVLDRAIGRSVPGDKPSAFEPEAATGDERIYQARSSILTMLEQAMGCMVSCPRCDFMVWEDSKACPECGLLADDVDDELVEKLRCQDRETRIRNLNLKSWALVVANADRRPRAITDERAGTEGASPAGDKSTNGIARPKLSRIQEEARIRQSAARVEGVGPGGGSDRYSAPCTASREGLRASPSCR